VITFSEYQQKGGRLDQTDFDTYEPRSASFVTALTFGRDLTAYMDTVVSCMVELIDSVVSQSDGIPWGATSYSNDGVSVSFGRSDSSSNTVDSTAASAYAVVSRWLALTGLMSRIARRP